MVEEVEWRMVFVSELASELELTVEYDMVDAAEDMVEAVSEPSVEDTARSMSCLCA